MAAGAAALMAGCSDASRFADPFTDPFSGSSTPQRYSQNSPQRGYDRAPTGSTQRYAPSRVESRPLAPAAVAPRTYSTPAPVAVAAPSPAPAGPGGAHWSIDGGTPITVTQGDTAAVLATRYGVPTDALLRANGYSSAAQVQPGTRLTIPVYRAHGAAASTPAVAAAPAAPRAIAPVAAAAPVKPVASTKESEELKRRKAEAEAAEAKQRLAEAKATQRLAEAKAAEQKLAESKAAEAKKAETKAAELKKAEAKVAGAKASDKKAAEAKLAAAKADAQKAEQAKLAAAKEAEKAQKASKLAEAKAKAATKVAAAPVEETPVAAKSSAPEPKTIAAAESKKIDKTTTTASIPQAAASAAAPAATAPAEEEKPVASADGKPEFRWPARGRIIQGYSSGGNDGINIAVPEGTPVKAAEGGTVAYAGSELKGYGNLVLIRHPNGFVTAYAHNGALSVKRGDSVKRGQTIATSGQSGNVGSPQLHFELRKGAQPVDPTTYMAGL